MKGNAENEKVKTIKEIIILEHRFKQQLTVDIFDISRLSIQQSCGDF